MSAASECKYRDRPSRSSNDIHEFETVTCSATDVKRVKDDKNLACAVCRRRAAKK
jgi:hypothetical protein